MAASAWAWLVVLGAITLGVLVGACREIDVAALQLAQSAASPALDLFGSVVGIFGRADVGLIMTVALVVARRRTNAPDALSPLLIVATVVAEVILKLIVPQPQPQEELVRSIDLPSTASVAFASSFPSGHVARVAFLLGIIRRMPLPVTVAGVVLMAATRVYLGEHWLSDTLGGAALGFLFASVARRSD